ncbi:MAG: aminopeptidase P family protein [Candidatus Heimdallarchaeota archaeon]|nr:MAG: aminopeptidase P family protein [Candidatus Heimdallarchaeota archaeon]
MRPITQEKMDRLTNFMEKNNIDLTFITDWGNARDVNMRYLTGHIMDANLIVTSGGETTLLPWDVDLAEDHAQVDTLVTDKDSRQNPASYVKEIAKNDSPVIGFNLSIPYRFILEIKGKMPEAKLFEEPHKLADLFRELRATKSPQELEKLIEAGKIGNKAINDIRKFAEEKEGTENDLSFLVMKKMREYGAEENSFPSLVANVTRSHMIHCHPSAGNNKYSENGLALIDYGARIDGYVCDITIPISFGKLTEEQEKIKKTCFKAYEEAIAAIDIGVPLWKISKAAVDVIEAAGYHMPHGLGHGLGLTVHDSPGIRQKPTEPERIAIWNEVVIEEGMVFTIEPGVYVKGLGGQRLENDVMIRNGKVEVYTNSEPIEI